MMNKQTNIYCFIIIFTVTIVFIFYSLNREENVVQDLQLFNVEDIEALKETDNNSYIFDLNLTYVIDSNVCRNSSNILAVILVTSYFGNVETRSAMRRAFSNDKLESLGLRRVFLLGIAPQDRYTKENSIEDEARRFGDIIQGNFMEAYRNLTYKHVMGMMWVNNFCNNASYIIKMDDDIVVNIVDFVKVLKNLTLPNNSLAGYILRGMSPIREPHNKWYVTEEEFSEKSYPTFVSGWFYITSPKTISKLLHVLHVMKPKYFWIDDLFVTGILARRLKVRHYDIGKYFAVHSEFVECCIDDIEKYSFKCDFLIGPNGGDNNLFYKFNKAVELCTVRTCSVRKKPIQDTCVAVKKSHLTKGNAIITNYKLH